MGAAPLRAPALPVPAHGADGARDAGGDTTPAVAGSGDTQHACTALPEPHDSDRAAATASGESRRCLPVLARATAVVRAHRRSASPAAAAAVAAAAAAAAAAAGAAARRRQRGRQLRRAHRADRRSRRRQRPDPSSRPARPAPQAIPLAHLTLYYDPLSYAAYDHPYDLYRQLRDHAPVYYNERRDLYVVSRHADVQAGLKNHEHMINGLGNDMDGTHNSYGKGNLVAQDPPRHTALRQAVRRTFAAQEILAKEDGLREFARGLLADMRAKGGGDFASEFALPLVHRRGDQPDRRPVLGQPDVPGAPAPVHGTHHRPVRVARGRRTVQRGGGGAPGRIRRAPDRRDRSRARPPEVPTPSPRSS